MARSSPILLVDEFNKTCADVALGVAQPIPTSKEIFSKYFSAFEHFGAYCMRQLFVQIYRSNLNKISNF
jgi:hypothetical protein